MSEQLNAYVNVEYIIPVARSFYVLRFSVDGSWWMASITRHSFTWNTLCRAIGELAIKTCNSPTRYVFPEPNLPPVENNLPPIENNLPYTDSVTERGETRTTDSVSAGVS